MDTANTATIVRLLLAWGAPLILLIVVTVRFFQRSRSRGSRRATGVGRPGAGAMRRRDRAIVDPARIDTIFRSAIVCRIALAADGVPYIVPLSYGVADSVADCMELEEARLRFVATGRGPYRIYFHAANEGRKLEMARSNPRVCIEVEGRVEVTEGATPCDWSVAYESVVGYGSLREVTDDAEKRAGLECIMKHNGAVGPFDFPEGMVAQTAVLRLDVTEITGKANRAEDEPA